MSESRLLVMGSANVDLCVYVDRAPGPGETVTGGRFARAMGGKGANQAVAARRAGSAVRFAGRVGDDEMGRAYRAHLEREKIGGELLGQASGTPTGCALITIDAAGENSIAVAPGANACVTPDDVKAWDTAIASSAMLVLQMELPEPTTAAALEAAGRHGVPAMLNYAPVGDGTVTISEAVTHLVVNQVEAAALLREAEPIKASAALDAAERLRARGPETATITLGGEGVITAWAGGNHRVAARRVEVVDTTAAGDTFCGYLASGLSAGRPIDEALERANAAAALAVTRPGAQPSIPTADEVDRSIAS